VKDNPTVKEIAQYLQKHPEMWPELVKLMETQEYEDRGSGSWPTGYSGDPPNRGGSAGGQEHGKVLGITDATATIEQSA